jgi:predicted amidohydrolase
VPEREGDKLYNTCFVFDEDGIQIAKHRKVHLFDVDIPGMRFHESHTFTPGEDITVFDTRYGRFGVAICFDVRFPELFRAMAKRGAKMIFLPAQFNMKTGPAHWDLSLRMRAVDNEVFFAGAAAARYEGFAYECWGHSAFIDPYGVVLSKCDEKERILYTEIDLSRVETVREQLPTFNRLREDVYPVAK